MTTLFEDWSETKDATEEIQQVSDQVKPEVETLTGKNYAEYTAVKYRNLSFFTGQYLLIKVLVGKEDYLHLMVFQTFIPFLKETVLQGVEQHRTKDFPLEPFTE